MSDWESGRAFETIMFRGSAAIEITFTEPHDRGEGVTQYRTVAIEPHRIQEHYAILISVLVALSDAALTVLRNAPDEY